MSECFIAWLFIGPVHEICAIVPVEHFQTVHYQRRAKLFSDHESRTDIYVFERFTPKVTEVHVFLSQLNVFFYSPGSKFNPKK